MHIDHWLLWRQSSSRTSSGVPLVLLLAGLLASGDVSAQTSPWRICEVYSNADGSSQFIQFCGDSDEQWPGQTTEKQIAGIPLVVGDGTVTHSFVPRVALSKYYDYHRFLVATQGFADLNIVKPDVVVPNGFVLVPSGSITLGYHDAVEYAGLPTDGFHAIDTGTETRPGHGTPSTAITLAIGDQFRRADPRHRSGQRTTKLPMGDGSQPGPCMRRASVTHRPCCSMARSSWWGARVSTPIHTTFSTVWSCTIRTLDHGARRAA